MFCHLSFAKGFVVSIKSNVRYTEVPTKHSSRRARICWGWHQSSISHSSFSLWRSGILLEEGLLDTIATWRLIARAPSPGPNAFLQDLASCNHATVHHLQTHTLLPGHAIAQKQGTGNEWGKVACANSVFASVGFRCANDPVHRANNRGGVCMMCYPDLDCERTADFAGQHTLIGIICLLELVYRLSISEAEDCTHFVAMVGPTFDEKQ